MPIEPESLLELHTSMERGVATKRTVGTNNLSRSARAALGVSVLFGVASVLSCGAPEPTRKSLLETQAVPTLTPMAEAEPTPISPMGVVSLNSDEVLACNYVFPLTVYYPEGYYPDRLSDYRLILPGTPRYNISNELVCGGIGLSGSLEYTLLNGVLEGHTFPLYQVIPPLGEPASTRIVNRINLLAGTLQIDGRIGEARHVDPVVSNNRVMTLFEDSNPAPFVKFTVSQYLYNPRGRYRLEVAWAIDDAVRVAQVNWNGVPQTPVLMTQ